MAQRRIEFHPEAVRDASEARLWYAERSGIAAERFVYELDQPVEQVMEAPDRWPRYVRGLRRYLFHRFPYMLVYRDTGAVILVIAVAHARRRPGFWKERLSR